MSLNQRNKNYVIDRLCVPAIGAAEAIDRLRMHQEFTKAQELMDALKVFTDVCRKVRHEIESDKA